MRRIKDYYHWTKLSHWNDALADGSVIWGQIYYDDQVEDAMIYRAIELLIDNCYPYSLICCHKNDSERVLVYTPLWKDIIQFVNGKRSIIMNEKQVFFKDLSESERHAVLNADIQSIWIANDNDDDLPELSVMLKDLCGYI